MLRRLWQKIKALWKLAKSERATPREIGWAVAIGAFAGCTPAIGIHGWLAIGIATLARKNRLFAWLGSRISNMLLLPFITLAEVQVAHRLRFGVFLDLTRDNVIDQAPRLLVDWCLGMFPVGGAIAVVMGFASYGMARRRDTRKRKAQMALIARTAQTAQTAHEKPTNEATPEPPAELPPPSSGSPA